MESIIAFAVQAKSIIVIIHAISGAVALGTTTVTDYLFFQFLKDLKINNRESHTLGLLSHILWTALALLIVSGCLLFLSDIARYSHSSKFLVKCIVVGVIAINGYILHRIVTPRMVQLDFATRTHRDRHIGLKRLAFACGGVSMFSWYLAFILGMLDHIPVPFWILVIVYIAALVGVIITGQGVYWYYHRRPNNES